MKQNTKPRNVFFHEHELFLNGEKAFQNQKYEKSLSYFSQLLENAPNSKKVVSGRIALTHMKLKNFEGAQGFLKEAIVANPTNENDYTGLYAECLYALGKFEESESYCLRSLNKYENPNKEVEQLYKKVSFHHNIDIIRESNGNQKDCMQAFENILEMYITEGVIDNEEEALQYAQILINSPDNLSTTPFTFLTNYYLKNQNFAGCRYLFNKVKQSSISIQDQENLLAKILSVYRLSDDYQYSKYCPEIDLEESKPLSELLEQFLTELRTKYLPVLTLDNYFRREPQFAFS